MRSAVLWLRKNWQPVTTAISLLFAGIGIYVGIAGHAPRPTFLVAPTRARIVDIASTSSPQIEVSIGGRVVKNRNVTAAVLYFWNGGNEPIRSSDVLEPFRIVLSPGAEVLDAKLLKQTRSVVGMRLLPPTPRAQNEVPIEFNIVEPQDGAAIQLLFSGDPQSVIHVEGTAVGARSISQLGGSSLMADLGQGWVGFVFALLLAGTYGLMGVFPMRLVWRSIRRAGPIATRDVIAMVVVFGLGLALLSGAAYYANTGYHLKFDIPSSIVSPP